MRAPSVEPVPFGDLGSYPLPGLRLSGGSSLLSLAVLTLENDHLWAVVCPSLGMRVLALFDKERGREVIAAPSSLEAAPVGRRGLWMQHGVQVSLDAEIDSMSRYDFVLHEGDEVAAVMMFGSVPGRAQSLQVCFSLPEGSRELLVEARVFSRSLSCSRFAIDAVGSGGAHVLHEVLLRKNIADGVVLSRVASGELSPRDTRAFRFRIGVDVASDTNDGVFQEEPVRAFVPSEGGADSQPISLRGAAHLREAAALASTGEFRVALDRTDSALATLGDDPLAWWYRAALVRTIGEEENDAELTTAHALSPMEPMLRAEAFLSVPEQYGKEPTSVMEPLVGDPDSLFETVHLLFESGLARDAARVVDEALRHKEFPLLRYVLAWNLYKSTRMQVEAADHVMRILKAPIEPPFPWRPLEVEAVMGLASAFPSDGRLRALAELLEKRNGPAT